MKKLLLLSALLISIVGYSQRYTSDVRAFVKVKTKRNGELKLKTEQIIRDRDELCLADNLLIVTSESKFFVDLTLEKENEDTKCYSGDDNGLNCTVMFFKTTDPKTLFLNYGEWGVVYFLNN